jgi:hypothetical protein
MPMSDLPKNPTPDVLVDSRPTEDVPREDARQPHVCDDDKAQLPLSQVATAAARVLGARFEAAAVESKDVARPVAANVKGSHEG